MITIKFAQNFHSKNVSNNENLTITTLTQISSFSVQNVLNNENQIITMKFAQKHPCHSKCVK